MNIWKLLTGSSRRASPQSPAVAEFSTTREAKEYLIAAILAQAQQDGVTLTDVEKQMLYFSETASTMPNILEIAEEFDRSYSQDEYEQKIASLVRSIRRDSCHDKLKSRLWAEAVHALKAEDHYLLVMIDQAG